MIWLELVINQLRFFHVPATPEGHLVADSLQAFADMDFVRRLVFPNSLVHHMFVVANGVDNDPPEFANFPCCLKYMPQLLRSCHALRVLGVGWVGGGVRGGCGGWGGIITSLHVHTYVMQRYCTLFCTSSISIRTSCYNDLMLRCKMSLALAHCFDARLQDVSCTCLLT